MRDRLPEPFASYDPDNEVGIATIKEMREVGGFAVEKIEAKLHQMTRADVTELLEDRTMTRYVGLDRYRPEAVMMALDIVQACRKVA